MTDKNLVVYYGMQLKKTKNGYFCNGAFGRYVDKLSNNYNKLFLVMPTIRIHNSDNLNEYMLNSKNIIVQELTGYNGYFSAMKNSLTLKREIKTYSQEWDCPVYIRWPVPFFQYVYKIAIRRDLPVYFHLVGDSRAVVSEGSKYTGCLKFIALKFADYNSRIMSKNLKTTPTLVNGSGLRRLYNADNNLIKEIRTSTFSDDEIVSRVKTLNKENIKVLYVGYLRHEKGLSYLFKAMKNLVDLNYNLKLTVVGEGDILNELLVLSDQLQISDRISFKGYLPLGDKLFELYEKHDIFVLPSISEGTPRVVIESMSKGTPVIATNVGGIPFTIKDRKNGILVDAKSSDQLSSAIVEIINNDNLREKIIMNGLEFAKENTIESHVNEVVKFIDSMSNR